MNSRRSLFVAAGLCLLLLLGWWLWPLAQETLEPSSSASETLRAKESTPPAAMPRMPAAEPAPAEPDPPLDVAPSDERTAETAEAAEAAEAPEAQGDLEHAASPTGDLEHYAKRPMSAVPHRVLRAWGAGDEHSQLGLVGAYLVVEPGISDEQLIKLSRDIQKYHRDAKALSVRILDSEEAATYDRHIDGGALGEQHEIATVTRDPTIGVNRIRVRGKDLDP